MHSSLKLQITRTAISLLTMFLWASGYSQSTPAPFPIVDDSTWQYNIPDSHVLYVYDSTGKLTLEEVRALALNGKLQPWRSEYSKKMKVREHYWFYFILTNRVGKPLESGFDSYANISDYHVIRNSGKVDFMTTGTHQSWKKKTEFYNSNVCPFRLSAGETVEVFHKAEFLNSRFTEGNFFVALANPDKYARQMLRDYEPRLGEWVTEGTFFSGIILLATIIYFFFFTLVRERVFLFFAIFLLGQAVVRIHYLQLLIRDYPTAGQFINFFGSFSFVFFLLFFREFLNTRKFQPRWDKFLLALAAIVSLTVIYVELFQPDLFDTTGPFVLGSTIVVMFITFFLLGKEQKKEKQFLLYATLPAIIVFMIIMSFTLILVNFVERNSPYAQQIGETWDFIEIFLHLTILWMILAFSRLLFRRFSEQRQKIQEQELEKEQILRQKEMERLTLIEQQKSELEKTVAERTAELKRSLEDLRATQAQLIQSEKMASLGEMTAGIAHEIQNPLNFVNNFAEVNAELADEINEEILPSLADPAMREKFRALMDDLKTNQEKIREHGKRADSIVKNMLQHSRASSQKKEPVQFNSVVEEYVKLSYHGFRGRDKSFNAYFQTQPDPSIDTVELFAQDFGRVVLNLVNNAFYAVREKAKTTNDQFTPTVIVKTERKNGMVILTVSDNGPGIPESVREKIFQPFFTTKPSGEGTGLGLSISYDIITKGHGGTMSVESREGEGSSFIITIPG
jgi:signal transduction histidine kinase